MSTLSQFFGGGGNSGGSGTIYSQNQNIKEQGDGELTLYEYRTPGTKDLTHITNACHLSFSTVTSGSPALGGSCVDSGSGALLYLEITGDTCVNCLNICNPRCASTASLFHTACNITIGSVTTSACCVNPGCVCTCFCVCTRGLVNFECNHQQLANQGAVYAFECGNTTCGFGRAGLIAYGVPAPTLKSPPYRHCAIHRTHRYCTVGYLDTIAHGLSSVSQLDQDREKLLVDGGLELLPSYIGGKYLISPNSNGDYSKLKTLFSPVGAAPGEPGGPGGFLGAGSHSNCRGGQSYGSGNPIGAISSSCVRHSGLAGIEYWNCT